MPFGCGNGSGCSAWSRVITSGLPQRRWPRSSPQEHNPAAKRLLEVVRFYEAWDDGDYARAGRLLADLQRELPAFTPPVAVKLLSAVWPSVSAALAPQAAAIQLLQQHTRLRQTPGSIFESNELLLAYARDELARIERLVDANEDNRSALLRAAGLDELLLKARWLRLWQRGWIEVWDGVGQRLGALSALTDATLADRLYDALLNHQGTDFMRWALQRMRPMDADRATHQRPISGSKPSGIRYVRSFACARHSERRP